MKEYKDPCPYCDGELFMSGDWRYRETGLKEWQCVGCRRTYLLRDDEQPETTDKKMRPEKSAICPQCSGASLDCELCNGIGEVPWPVFWDYIDDLMEIEELMECGAVAV